MPNAKAADGAVRCPLHGGAKLLRQSRCAHLTREIEPNAIMHLAGENRGTAARHAEVARRYAWQARQRSGPYGQKRVSLVRLRELERLYEYRWGRHLPDDDSGRDDLVLAAHHIAHLRGETS